MKFKEYKTLILSDLFRYKGERGFVAFLSRMTFGYTFPFNFWFRTCQYLKSNPVLNFPLYYLARLILNHYIYKFGILITPGTQIGTGLFIAHFGGIVVNPESKVGNNCTLSQGVTLGVAKRGKNMGVPVVGNNVYIGPGAKIVGGVKIGDNVAIGANCVVTHDIPDNAVVVGIPGRVISLDGSYGYVEYTDYD